MTEEEIREKMKNAHIKLDHYSWRKTSPYRVFEKEEFNAACMRKLEGEGSFFDLEAQKQIRWISNNLHIDPDNLPTHPSWEDSEFEKQALDILFKIVKMHRGLKQETALRYAEEELAEAKEVNNLKQQEIFERIVFELTEASEEEYDDLKKEVLEN